MEWKEERADAAVGSIRQILIGDATDGRFSICLALPMTITLSSSSNTWSGWGRGNILFCFLVAMTLTWYSLRMESSTMLFPTHFSGIAIS